MSKKDVVGMDRPRSEDEAALKYDIKNLYGLDRVCTDAHVKTQKKVTELEERVDDCYALISNLAIMHQENQQRVAELERLFNKMVKPTPPAVEELLERVAELERLWEENYDKHKEQFRPGAIPWGDRD